jgi:DNA modification methylase
VNVANLGRRPYLPLSDFVSCLMFEIGHPAPFPVELPYRLAQLFTFTGNVVLDPFRSSGTTASVALKSGRKYIGYESDPEYVKPAGQSVWKNQAKCTDASYESYESLFNPA